MGHKHPPTSVSIDYSLVTWINNDTAKQKQLQAIDMSFYLVRYQVKQDQFHIFWENGSQNMAYYVAKYHKDHHNYTMRPIYLHTCQKKILNENKTLNPSLAIWPRNTSFQWNRESQVVKMCPTTHWFSIHVSNNQHSGLGCSNI